jgi:disease resistance protein RPM1
LGKTTLARAVQDKIKGDFDCAAFVSVGPNACPKNVYMDILIDLDHTDPNLSILNETQLINRIRQFLENKRYASLAQGYHKLVLVICIMCAYSHV